MPITNVQPFMNHLVLDLKQFDRNISNAIRVLVTVRQRMVLGNFKSVQTLDYVQLGNLPKQITGFII